MGRKECIIYVYVLSLPWNLSPPNVFLVISKQMTPLEDIDKNHNDPFFNSIYAKDIFSYMKEREVCRWLLEKNDF